MIDGYVHTYREETNYSKTLNIEHDRQLLLPARSILKDKYDYDIPKNIKHMSSSFINSEVNESQEDVKIYESALQKCRKELDLGRFHLLNYFLEKSKELSEDTSEDEITISDRFSIKYSRSLNKLQKELFPFIENIQSFLSESIASK